MALLGITLECALKNFREDARVIVHWPDATIELKIADLDKILSVDLRKSEVTKLDYYAGKDGFTPEFWVIC